MDEKQLAKAGAHSLITVGCHTVSHPFLTQCDLSQLKYEIEASRQYLEDISGQRVDYFAYPTGDYDRSVAEAVMSAGYRAAFAELSKNIGLPAYEIPRVGIYRSETAYLAAKLSGLHQKPVSTIYD